MSDGILPILYQWNEPLKSVQFCRCTLNLWVARITIRTMHAFEVVQSRISILCCGHRASEFKQTRLLATGVTGRLVPASFCSWIRDSIAGLCCASGEKLDSTISSCSTILSGYTRTLGTCWHCELRHSSKTLW